MRSIVSYILCIFSTMTIVLDLPGRLPVVVHLPDTCRQTAKSKQPFGRPIVIDLRCGIYLSVDSDSSKICESVRAVYLL